MSNPVPAKQDNRRDLLKLSAKGILATAVAGTLAPTRASGQDGPFAISYAAWTHGNGLQVQFPERLASITRFGFGTILEGLLGTFNWFHLPIPTPVIINDVRLRISSVVLRFQTGSSDAFVHAIHVYDGDNLVADANNLSLSGPQPFYRLEIAQRPSISWGLSRSVGVGYSVEAMDHSMYFISAGADLVV